MTDQVQTITVTCEIPAHDYPHCPKCGEAFRWYDRHTLVCVPCQVRARIIRNPYIYGDTLCPVSHP